VITRSITRHVIICRPFCTTTLFATRPCIILRFNIRWDIHGGSVSIIAIIIGDSLEVRRNKKGSKRIHQTRNLFYPKCVARRMKN
jgi:hypothetical protein